MPSTAPISSNAVKQNKLSTLSTIGAYKLERLSTYLFMFSVSTMIIFVFYFDALIIFYFIRLAMAKSVRSKVRRRLRNCRAEHYY